MATVKKFSRHNIGSQFIHCRGPALTRKRVSGRDVTISQDPPWQAAAALISIATYGNDPERVSDSVRTLVIGFLREHAKFHGRWRELPRDFRQVRNRDIDRAYARVTRIWNDKRLPALEVQKSLQMGRMELLRNYRRNDYAPWEPGVPGFRIDNGVRTVADAVRWIGHPMDPENFTREIWSTARPIIHIIEGIAQCKPEGSLRDAINNPDWVPRAVSHSNTILTFYVQNPEILDIGPREILCVDLI